jgi:hypothetical protein
MRCRAAVGDAGWARGWLRPPLTRSARPGRRRWQPGRRRRGGRGSTISLAARATVSCRRRRSKAESSQLLITPASSQALHCHRIGVPGSVRSTIIRPGQARLAGRRRHGSALSQAVPASPAVAARTMLLRCSASRRAGPGVSCGRSRMWCRSVTNIPGTVSTRSAGLAQLVAFGRQRRAVSGRGRAGRR